MAQNISINFNASVPNNRTFVIAGRVDACSLATTAARAGIHRAPSIGLTRGWCSPSVPGTITGIAPTNRSSNAHRNLTPTRSTANKHRRTILGGLVNEYA
jgi:hypothetical protein